MPTSASPESIGPSDAHPPAALPPRRQAVDRVGDRWTLLVIDALAEGPRRFADLQADLSGIAPNILTQRLRSLEQQGLVVSRPYSTRPLRLTYELTAAGHDLGPALALLREWGRRHGEPGDDGLEPGADRSTDPACPTCGQPLDDLAVEATALRWV